MPHIPLFLVGLVLLVGVAVTSGDVAGIYRIEKDRKAVSQAVTILRDARKGADEQLADAKRRNDAVAEARAQTLLADIGLIERRTNPVAVARQVEANKKAFSEKNQAEFWPWLFTSLMGWRTIEKVKDVWEVGGGVLDIATAGGDPKPTTANELLERAKVAIGSLDRYGPLPPEIGDYLAASILDKVKRENPQIATLSQGEQMGFACGQARKRLADLLMNEPDDARRVILESAQKTMEARCAGAFTVQGTFTLTQEDLPGCQRHTATTWLIAYAVMPKTSGTIQMTVDLASGKASGSLKGSGKGTRPQLRGGWCNVGEVADVIWSAEYEGEVSGTADPATGSVKLAGTVNLVYEYNRANCSNLPSGQRCAYPPGTSVVVGVNVDGKVARSGMGGGTITITLKLGNPVTGDWVLDPSRQ